MADDQKALLIRGVGGEVYFLGHDDLARFRLSPESEAAANEALDAAEAADDPEVAGFSFTGLEQPRVHGREFRSIVYAPVMQGLSHATATPQDFTAAVPPGR